MVRIVEVLFREYDEFISEILSETKVYPSKSRKGLGRHIRRGDPTARLCRRRKIRKRGFRQILRKIKTILCYPILEELEKSYIEWILKETGENKTEGARALGIDRVSLWRKLKKYEME